MRRLPRPPRDNARLRRALYAGAVVKLAAGPASRALVRRVRRLLAAGLAGAGPPRRAQFRLGDRALMERLAPVRRALASDAGVLRALRAVMGAAGFDPAHNAVDAPRLRALTHGGHLQAEAAPAYCAHRDTWYANPPAQLNWWIPLHDVGAGETFVFFPRLFARPVPNDSARFDYARWKREVGWQRPGGARRGVYPSARAPLEGEPRLGFACRTGEVLLFSGTHLHQARRHQAGRTRFSVDFRTVHLGDHQAGEGAPQVDDRSRGSTLPDFAPPPRRRRP